MSSAPATKASASGKERGSVNKYKPKNYKKFGLKNVQESVDDLNARVKNHPVDEIVLRFDELPISKLTLDGLANGNFVEMTEIQKNSLPFALTGRDILGAAKTGSGKTLAFIIPVIEKLFREKWTQLDGLGALIISPTRELALQIFEVLKKVGKYHSFSAGLLIGGKDLKSEQERIAKMNILVTTPGRLLQHMDQTIDFTCDNLSIFVLDEADRILDAGFEKTINAIIDNLPATRQTLLFSATQTKSVKDLARLSLKNSHYVSVHEKSSESTPDRLVQKYIVCDLPQKLDILYSFIKTHLKTKMIIFLSSCKQVRFVHDTFCKMQPGVQLTCLHGKQKQSKRMTIFDEFCRKKTMCMFATDIAARGLDFPAVDWVVQADCPDDADTYIHRVGRTARYESSGNALLFLLASEKEGMLDLLQKKKIPIQEIKVNPEKIKISVSKMMQALCFKDPEIKYLGQKAFISYIRSIYLQKHKDIFNVEKLPLEAFAESLGLPGTPKLKFVQRKKNDFASINQTAVLSEDEAEENSNEKTEIVTKIDRMFKRKNMSVLSEHYQAMLRSDSEDDEGKKPLKNNNEDGEALAELKSVLNDDADDFMTIKRKNHDIEGLESKIVTPIPVTKKEISKAKERAFKERGRGKKMVFDDQGNAVSVYQMESVAEFSNRIQKEMSSDEEENPIMRAASIHVMEQALKMEEIDIGDKQVEKDRLREKKRQRRLREKEMSSEEEENSIRLADSSLVYEQDEAMSIGTDDEKMEKNWSKEKKRQRLT